MTFEGFIAESLLQSAYLIDLDLPLDPSVGCCFTLNNVNVSVLPRLDPQTNIALAAPITIRSRFRAQHSLSDTSGSQSFTNAFRTREEIRVVKALTIQGSQQRLTGPFLAAHITERHSLKRVLKIDVQYANGLFVFACRIWLPSLGPQPNSP